mmetsp:Transcript_6179/g.13450  ORF Transcript_6179/g.13450 Transcript_6179/m.13450 type:complete len:123 (+) Transcript_6179:1583-1951(+)
MSQYALEFADGPRKTEVNDRWLLEEESRSTRENAMYSLQIVKNRGWRSILLVTNPFHQWRSVRVFHKAMRDLGMEPLPVHVAALPFVQHRGYGNAWIDQAIDIWDFVRELLAIAYYKAKGFI